MIENVVISSAQGGAITLPLDDVVSGFPIQEITGLDPVKATLVSTVFAQQDGAQYQGGRREPRNVKFTLGLEPNWTGGEDVRDLRRQLYSVLMPKNAVTMVFTLKDGLVVTAYGVVESFESTLFSKDPAVDVNVICYDPDFIVPTAVVINGSTVTDSTMTEFTYPGTVETGILFQLLVDRTITGFTIYHTGTDGIPRSMLVSVDAVSGDVITISTVSGNKFATLTHASADSSILYGIAPQADWFQLLPGTNAMRVELSGTTIPYTVEYITRYGGL